MARKMSALQKKYFGKGHKSIYSRSVSHTAKRRGYAKKAYRGARGLGLGKVTQFIPPVLGGAADEMLSGMSVMGFKVPQGVGATLVGWFMKSPTTRDIGLYQIGRSIPHYFGAGGTNGVSGFIGQV